MPDQVIDGAVKLTDDDIAKLNAEQDVTKMDDAALQALADKSGDTVEHIKEMLNLHNTGEPAKKDGDTGGDDDKLLAGKYKTEGDLDQGIQSLIDKYGKEEAYKMLESKMGTAKKDDDTGGDDDALSDGDALSDDDAAAKAAADAAAKAGEGKTLDIEKYATEFAENEKLSDESYDELAKAGLDRELVDDYISGVAAKAELYTDKVMEKAGGEDKYNTLVEWGQENLTDAEKVRFNEAMNSQDLAQAGIVLDALSARYEKSEGSFERTGVEIKDNVDGSAVIGYASTEEMKRDMADLRYRSGDKAFHALVKAKMKASKVI